MNVLIINTAEKTGGAAIAARRLMEALRGAGINARMLVRDKQTTHNEVIPLPRTWRHFFHFLWERVGIWAANHFHKHNLFEVDTACCGTDITTLAEFKQADVIHLHWVNQGMLSLAGLARIVKAGKPIVWTMHDMWCFTGICHYSGSCSHYTTACRHCPLLWGGGSQHDIAWRTFQKKRQLLQGANITYVACSQWLAELARQSELLRNAAITSIPNAINTQRFHPMAQAQARERCALPAEKRLLLFGSVKITDKRKGFDFLARACYILANQHPELAQQIGVVVMGRQTEEIAHSLPFPVYSMNYVRDEARLAEIYAAVDLYVTPSLQDNLPNTIVEAMACGTPCVGFNVGGIPQMIDHLHNGYIAEYAQAADLAQGIYWTLTEGDPSALSEQARRKALATYAEPLVAKRYIEVYNHLLHV